MSDTARVAAPTALPPTSHGKLTTSAAGRRTAVLSVALVALSGALIALFDLLAPTHHDTVLTWWLIALLAIAAEFMVFDVEYRREVYSFTFSEVPLVLGLFLAEPRDLLVGRMVGELLYLVLRERQPARKVVLNLASFLAETTTLLLVFDALGGRHVVTDPVEWLRAAIAVAAAIVVGYLVVFHVVRWHGAPIRFGSVLGTGALTVPVNTSFALVVGVLLVDRPWATALLLGVAVFLVVAYRSYTGLRQRYDSLSLLYDFTRLVSGAQRPDAVLEAMLAQAKDLLRAERAEIWLQEDDAAMLALSVDDRGRHRSRLPRGSQEAMHAWFRAHPDASVVRAMYADDIGLAVLAQLRASDAIIAPITEQGERVGLVAVVNRLGEVNRFLESDRTLFATLSNHASVALENGRLIDRLHQEARLREHEALHDALTGLPNRVRFSDALHDELSTGAPLAVALMDLDGFKEVNDTLGHHAGDLVLVEVARRLSYAAADATLVARLGGDEFAVLVSDAHDRTALAAMASRVRDELGHPFSVEGIRIDVNASIGFALAPADATDAATLLQRADVAMYSAKSGHGKGVAFYDSIRDDHSPRRLALVNDLRRAIADDELTLAYQPKARLADGTVVGFEALVRWRHPHLGMVLPDEFIPVAERTGAIDELTLWVLRHATRQAGSWRRNGHDWSVAVNVAMRNLLDQEFAAVVEQTLAGTGCPPDGLTLEITESHVMSDPTRTVEVLHRLGALGVCLSIDDFGTGYSSLSYLQQLPVGELKVDQVFVSDLVSDPGAEAIVRSVLDLAHHLNLSVVAEGVEDQRTWARLTELGCRYAQGYVLARPMPPEDVERWSAEHVARLAAGSPWDPPAATDRGSHPSVTTGA